MIRWVVETEIVGREEELAQIDSFLVRDGPRALLLEGEAGIGKTTLWRAGVERARDNGCVVVDCAPSRAESHLAFAALGDLLRAVDDSVFEALPAPQRRALEGALLLREPERPPEGRALGLALVRLLRGYALEAKVIVAIDDTQWLDHPSRGALTFAVRRLEAANVGLLLARRTGEGDPSVPLELDQLLPATAFETRTLGSMSLGALGRLVRQRLGLQMRRPELLRLEALSGGNPLFAVELAPTLAERGTDRLPASLSAAIQARLAELEEETLDALLVAAVSPSPSLEAIEEVVGTPDTWRRLAPARDAGILTLEGAAIRFVHPLYAAAVLERASPKRAAEVHRRLAAFAATPELRAHHLAASTKDPDEQVAAAIEAGAREAMLRGAPDAAAELAARAYELSPDDGDAARRRGVLRADCVREAGDVERGRALLAGFADSAPPGPARAEILFKLAQIPRNFEESVALCEQALEQAAGTSLAAEIGVALAASLFVSGHGERSVAEASRAIETASTVRDELTESRARAVLAMIEGARGNGWDLETLRRAADLELAKKERPDPDGAALWYVQALHFNDLFDDARERGIELRERALGAGEATAAAEFVAELATIETRAGNFDAARRLAMSALEEYEQLGWEQGYGSQLELLALIDAWLGREDTARAGGERGIAITRAAGEELGEDRYLNAMIVLELGLEHWASAAQLTEEGLASSILEDPSVTSLCEYGAEAQAAIGNLARAQELTERLEATAAARPTPRFRLESFRCRGLVLAAESKLEDAIASLEQAVDAAAELGLPHQRGRTLLMLGRVQRRARRRADARASLTEAIALLEQSGARLFADQAKRELARVGGRAPAGDVLTVTERRVADLVAEGRSNKEVAAALFVTVKAVEANLSRVYAKLGIRSRTELARLLSGGDGPGKT